MQRLAALQERYRGQEAAVAAPGRVAGALQERCIGGEAAGRVAKRRGGEALYGNTNIDVCFYLFILERTQKKRTLAWTFFSRGPGANFTYVNTSAVSLTSHRE